MIVLIINKEGNLFIIKVYREYIDNFDIYDIDNVTDIFKNVLIELKKKYNIRGLCDIDVYVNYDFGMIIEVDNIYKYGEDIDVKIRFHIDSYFFNEIDFDPKDRELYRDIYYYKNKYYTNYNKFNDSDIIYKDSDDIISYGIKLK